MYIHLRLPSLSHFLTVSFPPYHIFAQLLRFSFTLDISRSVVISCPLCSLCHSLFSLFSLFSHHPSIVSNSDSSHSSRCTMDLHETPLWISIHTLLRLSLLYVTLSKSVTFTHTNVHTRCHLRFFILYIYIYIYMHIRNCMSPCIYPLTKADRTV